MLPLSGIGHSVDFLVLIYFYYRLRKSRVANNKFFYYFERFTLSMSLFFVFMAVPNLFFTDNTLLLGWGYVIGHIFLYVSYAYLVRVSLLILKPSFESTNIFKAYLLAGAGITAVNILLFNYPVVLESGITAFNADPIIGILIVIISVLTLLPSAVLFIIKSIQQPQQRRRFAFIGISFLLIIAGGPLHDLATTPAMYMLADAITTTGFVVMLLGVVFGNKSAVVIKK